MKLYLDVDGVINAQMPPWHDVRTTRASGYRVRWAADMITALRDLDLDLVWLTSWGRAAPENLAFELEYGQDKPAPVEVPMTWEWTSLAWKFPGLKELEPDPEARFVWIDDETAEETTLFRNEVAVEARAHYPNALIIAPRSHLGITKAHIEQIREYISD